MTQVRACLQLAALNVACDENELNIRNHGTPPFIQPRQCTTPPFIPFRQYTTSWHSSLGIQLRSCTTSVHPSLHTISPIHHIVALLRLHPQQLAFDVQIPLRVADGPELLRRHLNGCAHLQLDPHDGGRPAMPVFKIVSFLSSCRGKDRYLYIYFLCFLLTTVLTIYCSTETHYNAITVRYIGGLRELLRKCSHFVIASTGHKKKFVKVPPFGPKYLIRGCDLGRSNGQRLAILLHLGCLAHLYSASSYSTGVFEV